MARGAQTAGQGNVLARVCQLDDFAAHLIGLSENNCRANFSPWEMSLEAARLLERAGADSRPHTQRDLARYLKRNVSLVNRSLTVAAAITIDILKSAAVKAGSVCQLPHVTLRRIAKLPEPGRQLIFVRAPHRMSVGDRAIARLTMQGVMDGWATTGG